MTDAVSIEVGMVEVQSLDLQRQLKALGVSLGAALEERDAIYLDTCFWIHLRDAQRGGGDPRAVVLLAGLREAVGMGRAFCPISESTVFELLKQTDPVSRTETAQIMDELSLGVAILGGQERMTTELAHFIHGHAPPPFAKELHPLRHLVWTRGLGVMGIRVPPLDGLEREVALEIQRGFVDEMWNRASLSDIAASQWSWPEGDDDFSDLTGQLNRDVAAHQAELRSFQHAYRIEAAGAADIGGDMAMEIVADMAARHGQATAAAGSQAWLEAQRSWRGLLAEALRKGPSRHQLRSMHVAAALHAAIRWNAGQQFDSNDIYDIEHAGAALAHCQAFFTERPLWQVVTAGNVGLDRMFECKVVWKLDDAVAYVESFLAGATGEKARGETAS